jgi:hypothetical protein
MPDRQHAPLPDISLDPAYFTAVRENAGKVFDAGLVSPETKVAIKVFLDEVEAPEDPELTLAARVAMADVALVEAQLVVPVDQIPGHDPGETPLPVGKTHIQAGQTLARSVLRSSIHPAQPRR